MLTTRQETEERLHEFARGRRSPVWFNVAPRYTPGSPALVSSGQALHVAASERQAMDYEDGPTRPSGIVEATVETRKGWDTLDLITGERRLVPFEARR